MNENLNSKIDEVISNFSDIYKAEIKRYLASGALSEEEITEGYSFLRAALHLTSKSYMMTKAGSKQIYDNLQHF